LIEINRNPSARELRQFGTIWLPAFLLLVAAALVRRWHAPILAAAVPAVLAAIAFVVAWAAPARLKPVFVGMMVATSPIGWLVSHLIMVVIYFVVLTPIGVLRRTFWGDALHRHFDTTVDSYWIPRPPEEEPRRYFKQF